MILNTKLAKMPRGPRDRYFIVHSIILIKVCSYFRYGKLWWSNIFSKIQQKLNCYIVLQYFCANFKTANCFFQFQFYLQSAYLEILEKTFECNQKLKNENVKITNWNNLKLNFRNFRHFLIAFSLNLCPKKFRISDWWKWTIGEAFTSFTG